MGLPQLGLAYTITREYVLRTLPSLVSILENNSRCRECERVDLSVFFYIQNIDENSGAIRKLKEICNEYNVKLHITDSNYYVDILKEIGDKEYNGSYVIDLFLVVPEYLDVSYNVLFLQSDVVMNYGQPLYELAQYDFEGGRKSCASTIDMENSSMVKKVVPLSERQYVFNCGVFLVSPKNYKKHGVFNQYVESIKEKGWKFNSYFNVLRNAYGLKNELCILPMKYQVYPGQKMLNISQWKQIFGLDDEQYYTDKEIEEALSDPVFVHYINFVVKKPWNEDMPRKYKYVGYWPYQKIWIDYAKLLGIKEVLCEPWEKTLHEKIKRFFYDFCCPIYVFLCTLFYKRDVMRCNRAVYKLDKIATGRRKA